MLHLERHAQNEIDVTADERGELEAVIRKRGGSAALARRARCVLLRAEGEPRVDIRAKLAWNDAFVTRWTKAFALQGLAGRVSLHPGRAPAWSLAFRRPRASNPPGEGPRPRKIGFHHLLLLARLAHRKNALPGIRRRHHLPQDDEIAVGIAQSLPRTAPVQCGRQGGMGQDGEASACLENPLHSPFPPELGQ